MKSLRSLFACLLFLASASAGLVGRQVSTGPPPPEALRNNDISRLYTLVDDLPASCDHQCIFQALRQYDFPEGAPRSLCGENVESFTNAKNAIWSCVDTECPEEKETVVNPMLVNFCVSTSAISSAATAAATSRRSLTSVTPTTTISSLQSVSTSPASVISASASLTASTAPTAEAKPAVKPEKSRDEDNDDEEDEDEEEASSKGSKLSGGAIAGIVIGILAFIGLTLLAFWFVRRNRKSHRRQVHSMSLEPTSPRLGGPGMMAPQTGWENLRSNPPTPSLKSAFASSARFAHSRPSSTPLSFVDTHAEPAPYTRQDSELAAATGRTRTPVFSYQPPTPSKSEGYSEPVSPVSSIGDRGSIILGRGAARTPSIVSVEDYGTAYGSSVPFEYEPEKGSWSHKGPSPLSMAVADEERGRSSPRINIGRVDTEGWGKEVGSAAVGAKAGAAQRGQRVAGTPVETTSPLDRVKRWSRESGGGGTGGQSS